MLVLYSSTVLIYSIVTQCNVNPTPDTDDRKETGWEAGNETDLAQDRGGRFLLRTELRLRVSIKAGNF
jgi:hypothetical protein